MEPASSGRTDEEWQAAEKLLTSLQLARKNYSLYPENHINCERALEQFWLRLDQYIRAHGNLRFELTKDQLIFQEEVIFSEPAEEGNLPFTLFRDGIQWLEFQAGIDSEEAEQFLGILNKYRILTDEPEGDLVTALWEARFPHIQYHVADFFWGAESEIDLTASTGAEADSELSEEEEKVSDSECFPPIDPALLKITPEEEGELQEMVRWEEKRDPMSEYLDALLDSLLEYRDKESFDSILESMEEVFQDTLARKDFDSTTRASRAHHRATKSHGLYESIRRAFPRRGQHEHAGGSHEWIRVIHKAGEVYRLSHSKCACHRLELPTETTFAKHDEPCTSLIPHNPKGPQQGSVVLFRTETADRKDYWRLPRVQPRVLRGMS